MVLLLLAVVVSLVVPRLISAEQATAARGVQVSLELVASALVDSYFLTGAPPGDVSEVQPMVPKVDLLATNVDSASRTEVSVGVSGTTVALAATDEEGWCWMLVRKLVPSGTFEELKIAVEGANCDGTAALAYASADPPAGKGVSWASPWLP